MLWVACYKLDPTKLLKLSFGVNESSSACKQLSFVCLCLSYTNRGEAVSTHWPFPVHTSFPKAELSYFKTAEWKYCCVCISKNKGGDFCQSKDHDKMMLRWHGDKGSQCESEWFTFQPHGKKPWYSTGTQLSGLLDQSGLWKKRDIPVLQIN
jgi:hypothetical protein